MKLWLVKWTKFDIERPWYDTYDSFVCAAETEEHARNTMPREGVKWGCASYDPWAKSVDDVTAVMIGEAAAGTEAGVILASFNAA